MNSSDSNGNKHTDNEKRWSWQKRLKIYAGAAGGALIIGLVCAGAWFYQTLEFIKALSKEQLCESTDPRALKILFVGNSFTYTNSLPREFAFICQKYGQPLKLYQVVEPGQTFAGHLARGRVSNILKTSGPWDYVVLQEQSSMPCKDKASMEKNGKILVDLVRENGAKPVLFMTWADKGDVASQTTNSDVYKSLGRTLNTPVIPVGDVWFTAQREHPELELYSSDKHHPAPKGTYLAALLIFCELTNAQPDNAPSVIPFDSERTSPLCTVTEKERDTCVQLVRNALMLSK